MRPFHGKSSQNTKNYYNQYPIQTFATTKQVANMAAFLSSDEASCVSGAVYVVNGAIEAA